MTFAGGKKAKRHFGVKFSSECHFLRTEIEMGVVLGSIP